MILIIDNYDSFTYNLYQYIGEINPDIEVYRNDKISIKEIEEKNPSHIIISPGPGFPKDAGISIELIKELGPKIPILGVCLGHQAIGEAFGGLVTHAKELMHGKASEVDVDRNCELFAALPEQITVGRYHSLIVKKEDIPNTLKITAKTADGEIMGLQHVEYPVYGIQFHPESILTPRGKEILRNFLKVKSNVMNLKIEKAAKEDAKEILELQKLAYISEAEIINDFSIAPLTQTMGAIEKEFESNTFLKAVINDKIIGSLRGFEKDETCYIGRVIVHPDYQNKGIGTKLLNEIEKDFSTVKRFELFTGFKSERNLYLYKKLGFSAFKMEEVNDKLKLIYLEKLTKVD